MEFEAVIGLEIHVEMKTISKMFSSSPVRFGDDPNTNTSVIDFAFPGTLPVVNKQAVVNAIRVCNALHMDIDRLVKFDRKNYFYSDLPKGYQITQQFFPIGKNGYLEIETEEGKKKIGIERLHMEEDTCKQLHSWDCSLVDYNRAGIPLVEIVSKPDMHTGQEAMKYVEKIRSIVSFLDVSDGKMEEGSLRCDVNISVKDKASNVLGTKVEIKNLNSLNNIKLAIDFETQRQIGMIICGVPVLQETRRFDEASKETVLMRLKTDSVDYKYFPEPNILPIELSEEFVSDAIKTSNELADAKLERYKEFGLSDYDSSLLLSHKDISEYYDAITKERVSPKLAANWVIGDIQSILNKEEIEIKDFKVKPQVIAKLIKSIEEGKISNKQAREIFASLLEGKSLDELLSSNANSLISDEAELLKIINNVLDNNAQSIIDYKAGKDRALGFMVGQIMKLTHGKANPKITSDLLVKEINKR